MDTINKNIELRKELEEYGFQQDHIELATQISNNKEEVLNIILRMIEEPLFFTQMKENIQSKSLTKNIIENENDVGNSSNFKMVIVVRKDLKMGEGKIAAQVGHGVLGAYKMALENFPQNVKNWENFSGSAKIVLSVNSEEDLTMMRNSAKNKNLPYYLVRDAGRTQVPSGSMTVCAIGPGRVNEIDAVTGHLSLL